MVEGLGGQGWHPPQVSRGMWRLGPAEALSPPPRCSGVEVQHLHLLGYVARHVSSGLPSASTETDQRLTQEFLL